MNAKSVNKTFKEKFSQDPHMTTDPHARNPQNSKCGQDKSRRRKWRWENAEALATFYPGGIARKCGVRERIQLPPVVGALMAAVLDGEAAPGEEGRWRVDDGCYLKWKRSGWEGFAA
jgi:hypothetical protein